MRVFALELDNDLRGVEERKRTIEDLIEPYLLQNGFINRTPRGRMATARAYEHMGLAIPEGFQV